MIEEERKWKFEEGKLEFENSGEGVQAAVVKHTKKPNVQKGGPPQFFSAKSGPRPVEEEGKTHASGEETWPWREPWKDDWSKGTRLDWPA